MKEHGRLKKNGTPLCNPNTEGKLISINENVHAELKRLNKKSGISIKRLTEEFIKEGIRKNHEADKIKSEEE
ncbi:MAG TPA: hypothetical protein ENI08_00760 [Candidatus Dependentiae bacterium]|nr:hypothetical protein [Candidatus Dependentiae bacterium]